MTATRPDEKRKRNVEINALVAGLGDRDKVHYLDLAGEFLDENRVLPKAVMPDALHPNERGYQIWAEAMEPTLSRLIGDDPVR